MKFDFKLVIWSRFFNSIKHYKNIISERWEHQSHYNVIVRKAFGKGRSHDHANAENFTNNTLQQDVTTKQKIYLKLFTAINLKQETIMKYFSLVFIFLLFMGCEGPMGPPGEPGPAGPVGKAFEVEADFNEGNEYSQLFTIPGNIEVLASDIVAVYLLWDVDEAGNDVWQPLPVSVFFDDGELQYGFDHTLNDVQLFLTGDTDLSTLPDSDTQNQIFRIAILPVDDVEANNIDMKNIEEVMKAVDQSKIQRLQPAN